MKIKVKDLPEEGELIKLDEGPEWFIERLKGFRDADVHPFGRVEGEIFVQPMVDNVLTRGHAKCGMRLTCDRCLKEFDKPMDVDINCLYEPGSKKNREAKSAEIELSEGEMESGFYYGGEIDMRDVIAEAVLLSLPISIVCGDSCKGLCPVCGKDQNLESCPCDKTVADPRWAGLKNFKVKKQQ